MNSMLNFFSALKLLLQLCSKVMATGWYHRERRFTRRSQVTHLEHVLFRLPVTHYPNCGMYGVLVAEQLNFFII